jgi:hypothetical protein
MTFPWGKGRGGSLPRRLHPRCFLRQGKQGNHDVRQTGESGSYCFFSGAGVGCGQAFCACFT